jgi:hypothetical protein
LRWTGEDPDAVRGEDRVERSGEPGIPISEQELHGGDRVAEIRHQVASSLSGPRTGRMRRDPGQMCPARTVFDRDQRVEPPEEHDIYMHEVHSQNSVGLGG